MSFAYRSRPDKPVLEALSLQLRDCSVTAIRGASGTGKSTLCGLLSGLFVPTAGRVLCGGEPLAGMGAEQARARVGVVEQSSGLMSGSVRDNIKYGKVRHDTSSSDPLCLFTRWLEFPLIHS